MRRAIAIAAAIAITVSLGGCSALIPKVASNESVPTGETVSADLEPYYAQVLEWNSCANGMQCATAKAPLDWSDPAADSIDLALTRTVATGSTPIGSILVNPGGPGGSGVDFVQNSENGGVTDAVHERFDIVGFDPRGVGASTSVSCASDPAVLDKYFFGDPSDDSDLEVGSDAWLQEGVDQTTEFGQECLANTGPLLEHVDTESAARDMDMLRAALGDTKLTYLGFSYGTYLGATYADLYPANVGRVVLDGAVDPAVTSTESSAIQAVGFENALKAYLTDCIGQTSCPFTATVDADMLTIRDLLDALDESPLRNTDGRELDSSAMTTAIVYPLYDEANWPYLDQLFSSVMAGDPSLAWQLVDGYYDRDTDGTYLSNTFEAFIAINCLDDSSVASFDEVRAQAAEIEKVAPVFGPQFGYGGAGCSGWPFTGTRTPGPITAEGSGDILVVGTTNDPATPYEQAVSLADELENGHLVTYNGEGHTAYGRSTSCILDTVDAYFLEGTVPETDPQC